MSANPRKNRKYPWEKIPVNGSINISMRSAKAIKSAINAAYGYGERTGKKFTIKRSIEEDENQNEVHVVNVRRIS